MDVDPSPPSAPYYPAWLRATPFVRASLFRGSCFCVSILTRTSLQNAWSFRERARLARRNSAPYYPAWLRATPFVAGFAFPLLVLLRLDPHENVAPERVELSRAGALSAPQFGFDALDGVFRPELRNEFLDATPEDAHEDALFVWRGRGVKSLWRSILDIRRRVRLEGLK